MNVETQNYYFFLCFDFVDVGSVTSLSGCFGTVNLFLMFFLMFTRKVCFLLNALLNILSYIDFVPYVHFKTKH